LMLNAVISPLGSCGGSHFSITLVAVRVIPSTCGGLPTGPAAAKCQSAVMTVIKLPRRVLVCAS
jgi:hypothetical protein